MSFLGKVEARCPKGCAPREVDIWSFIDGSQDTLLRESLLAGDLNLIACEECGQVFYPEATVIYQDATAKILAFVFPESYRREESVWRKKMEEDYTQMQKIIPKKSPVVIEPKLYFGIDLLRQDLQAEEGLKAEVEIAELLSRDMKLGLYPVDRSFARSENLPWLLPYQGSASLASVTRGLQSLLKSNDRLEGYRRWEKTLASLKALPPGTL